MAHFAEIDALHKVIQDDPPVERPDDGNRYIWNEDTTSWDEVDMGAE
jgi:hypothetical protein